MLIHVCRMLIGWPCRLRRPQYRPFNVSDQICVTYLVWLLQKAHTLAATFALAKPARSTRNALLSTAAPITKSILIALLVTFCAEAFPQLPGLTDGQIDEAIALGKHGNVVVPLVGRILGISKGDFDVFIEGPMARIALAAEQATKQLRPFARANVTAEMKEPLYRVIAERAEHANGPVFVQHVVLMPKGSKNLEEAIQPVRETRLSVSTYFDRLADASSTSSLRRQRDRSATTSLQRIALRSIEWFSLRRAAALVGDRDPSRFGSQLPAYCLHFTRLSKAKTHPIIL